MSKKLYVGNLPFTSTEEELRTLFGRHGSVDSVTVIMDRETQHRFAPDRWTHLPILGKTTDGRDSTFIARTRTPH